MEMQQRTVFWLLIALLIGYAENKRTHDLMYESINGASCFRRLNGTHQTGCTSDRTGSVGVLHLVEVESDLEYLLQNPVAPPYAPMIPPHLFTRRNLLRLKHEGGKNISVVLLINRTDRMTQFSHELNCPNQYSGIMLENSTETATCDARNIAETWNPWGTGLLHEDFSFPIYYIADVDEIEKLVNCSEKFNNFNYEGHALRSLCAVEVSTFMSAAVNTEVCMRRSNFVKNLGKASYCDPLEGRNVYATLFPRNTIDVNEVSDEPLKVNTTEKFILISTRLDTTSMFDGVGLGALDSLMGFAALVNVAHMLKQLLPDKAALLDKNLNILFVIFNGESYDYIGSQRFVYDMENLEFPTLSTHTAPISFENIEFMLDIGTLDDIVDIKFHTIKEFDTSKMFLEKLQKYATSSTFGFKFNIESVTGFKIPPTSAQSFLRKNRTFPAFVLNAPPSNKYYHSIYDDIENVNFTYGNTSLDYTKLMEAAEAFRYFPANSIQMKIRNISSVISMALYETLTGAVYSATKIANPILADEFLYCFLQSADCPLFKAASHTNSLPALPIPPIRYISVANGPQESSGWTYRVLGFILSGRVENHTKENCTIQPLNWYSGYDGKGECRRTTQNYTHALSPAFIVDKYDWKSGQYSTWTESTWSQFRARIFLRPSRVHEIVTLGIGIIVFIISFCLIYIINNRSEVLFENAQSSTHALTVPTAC